MNYLLKVLNAKGTYTLRLNSLIALLFLFLGLTLFTACNQDSERLTLPEPSSENQYTPVVTEFTTSPQVFQGSDNKKHMVYEMVLTNTTQLSFLLNGIKIYDFQSGETLKQISDENIKVVTQSLTRSIPLDTIKPGVTAVVFIEISIENNTSVSNFLGHDIEFILPEETPAGFREFMGLEPTQDSFTVRELYHGVNHSDIARISPPLRGEGWIAADGCCTAVRHVRAMLPVNGSLKNAQRFAIDWEMMNEDNYIYIGDSEDVNNYFCYGKDVLAVADATVIKVVNGLPDQVPGSLPDLIPLSEADGNHIVLKLWEGVYAMYAHLIDGSITVSEGDKIKKGDVLAKVGNSGNTSAPHLHFHLMDGPSSLGSDGIPYVIDKYTLSGYSASTEAFNRAEIDGIPLEVNEIPEEIQENTMPMDQAIVEF